MAFRKLLFTLILFQSSVIVLAQSNFQNDQNDGQKIYSKINFSQLPQDVQLKIAENKKNNTSLFDGIAKIFVADVSIINSDYSIKNNLPFLFQMQEVKKVNYIKENRIEIITIPSLESTYMKDIFLLNHINANFIEQKFVVFN